MTEYKQIKSIKDETSGNPWYELDINNLPPEIAADNDDGTDTDTTAATCQAVGDVDPDNPTVDAVYGVTEQGDYICYASGELPGEQDHELRANLAWYDATEDEFTVLEFVEYEGQ